MASSDCLPRSVGSMKWVCFFLNSKIAILEQTMFLIIILVAKILTNVKNIGSLLSNPIIVKNFTTDNRSNEILANNTDVIMRL